MTQLFENPSFEDGWYDDSPKRQVPNGWAMWFVGAEPEANVKHRSQIPPEEWPLFFLDGDYCWKVFTTHEPMMCSLRQDVHTLAGEFEIEINFYADVFVWENDQKNPPSDPWSAMVRLVVDGSPVVSDTSDPDGWEQLVFLNQNQLRWTVELTEGDHLLSVEFWGKHPISNNGFFCDAWSMTKVGDPPPQPDTYFKLGPHVSDGPENYGDVPAMFLMNDWGWIGNVVHPHPNAIVFGVKHLHYDAPGLYAMEPDPAQAARKVMGDYKPLWDLDPHIKHWALGALNEPAVWDDDFVDWWIETLVECCRIARTEFGVTLAVGGFSTGTPPGMKYQDVEGEIRPANDPEETVRGWDIMKKFSIVLEEIWDNGHFFTMHEYFTDHPDEDIEFPFAEYPLGKGVGLGYNCGRYRAWTFLTEDDPLDPAYVPLNVFPPIIIDELGTGWVGRMTAQEYIAALDWYRTELIDDDPFVWGALVFTGSKTGQWPNYNIYGTQVHGWLQQQSIAAPPPAFEYPEPIEPPGPPPDPCPGLPREQYKRVYNVIPDGATEEQATSIFVSAWRRSRETVGGSYDDAGVGALDDKTAVLYGIDEEDRPGFVEFYRQFYPGTQVRFESLPGDPPPIPPPAVQPKVGLHDESGGWALVGAGPGGYCLCHSIIGVDPVAFDFSVFANNGIDVVLRLNWAYGGGGTFPPPDYKDAWISAVVNTIVTSQGVKYVHLGNEPNNPGEWAGGYPNPTHVLSPEYCMELWNEVAAQVAHGILCLPPIDPFNVLAGEFGQPADPKDWFQTMLGLADAQPAAFIMHGKTQTNAPEECWSHEKFSDQPLTGRYLHLRTLEDQVSWIPQGMKGVPIIVGELNPQLRTDGTPGWDEGNAEWVSQAMSYLRWFNENHNAQVHGACFYRYELAYGGQEGYCLSNKPIILNKILEEGAQ